MTKPNGPRWLPAILLVLILYPAFASDANAQVDTTYNIGDIVEFQYNNQIGISGPAVWMKGKIATKCSDVCGVLKWDDSTADWPSSGTIYTYLSNIRRPGAHQSAPPPQAPAAAQAGAAYKIGDRIDLLAGSVQIGGKYVGGRWQPGTVIAVTQAAYEVMYLVRYNENQDYWASASQMRAGTAVISDTDKARNALAALGALKAPKAGSLDETLQNVIREIYEQRGSKELPVTVAFQGFVVGQTHRYSRPDVYGESADGPGGSGNTTVYPVSTQLTVRTAYRDAFLTYQWDEIYKCFTNAFGKWQCNLDGGRGMIKQFREERASYVH